MSHFFVGLHVCTAIRKVGFRKNKKDSQFLDSTLGFIVVIVTIISYAVIFPRKIATLAIETSEFYLDWVLTVLWKHQHHVGKRKTEKENHRHLLWQWKSNQAKKKEIWSLNKLSSGLNALREYLTRAAIASFGSLQPESLAGTKTVVSSEMITKLNVVV